MKLNKIAIIGIVIGVLGGLAGLIAGIVAAPTEGIFIALIFVGTFSLVYWIFFRPMISANRILKTGEERSGKIIQVWDTGVTINNNPQVGLLVEVTDKYGKTYQTKTKLVVSRLEVNDVRPGLGVMVKVDPRNPEKIAIESFGSVQASANMTPDAYKQAMEKIVGKIDEENKDIMLTGISAEAKVISYYDLNVKVNGDNPLVMLFLEVQPGLKEPFYAEAKGVVAIQSVPKFQPGELITVKYDPKDQKRVTVEHS